jgi:hypothetical protein
MSFSAACSAIEGMIGYFCQQTGRFSPPEISIYFRLGLRLLARNSRI